jgi:hypothetical protein
VRRLDLRGDVRQVAISVITAIIIEAAIYGLDEVKTLIRKAKEDKNECRNNE